MFKEIARTMGGIALSMVFSLGYGSSVAIPSLHSPLTANATTLTQEEKSVVSLFERSTPSVLYVTNLQVRQDYFTLNLMEYPSGTGSGFIWDANGHVVTNYHVIKGARDIKVTLSDQSTISAQVVGVDEDKDVAVLKIDPSDNPNQKYSSTPLPVGESENLKVGQSVYAIGNPFGLDHTLTTGIISGVGREITGASGKPIEGVIQTDAAINPGNSGGPLLDSQGRVIGINTAIYSPSGASSGVGFAIPIDTVKGIVEQIIKFGKVTRPVLGISFAPDTTASQLGIDGILVLDVQPNGPAAMANIMPTIRDSYGRLKLGDIIIKINDKRIRNGSDLFRALDKLSAGEKVNLTLLREDNEVVKSLELGSK